VAHGVAAERALRASVADALATDSEKFSETHCENHAAVYPVTRKQRRTPSVTFARPVSEPEDVDDVSSTVDSACNLVRDILSQSDMSSSNQSKLRVVLNVLKQQQSEQNESQTVWKHKRSISRQSSISMSEAEEQINAAPYLDSESKEYVKTDTGLARRSSYRHLREVVRAVVFVNRLKSRSKSPGWSRASSKLSCSDPGCDFSSEIHKELEKIYNWEAFDVFYVAQKAHQRPLECVGLKVLEAGGVLRHFGIEIPKITLFLREIENQYKGNPYHNSLHAADVAQGVFVLTRALRGKEFSELEILTSLFAAICHDVGHPGVTNGFRINARDEDAVTYNDKSVNENMHCAMTYRTLQMESCDWLGGLSREQDSAVRKGLIGIVLGTDMAHHFAQLDKFKLIAEEQGSDPTKWGDSRLIAMEWLVHSADISAMSRPMVISARWTNRVLQEFYDQGDRERVLGQPISPLCDRNKDKEARAQTGFVDFIVLPTFNALGVVCEVTMQLNNLKAYRASYNEQLEKLAKEEADKETKAT